MRKIIDKYTNMDISSRRKWELRHPERYNEAMRNWYKNHSKQCNVMVKRWRMKHQEEIKINNHKYYLNHKEKINNKHQKWYLTHLKQIKDYLKNYAKEYRLKNPEKIKAKLSKRQRNLGFEILWQPENISESMEYHHINKYWVVLIPKKLHQSVSHSVIKNKNMKEINELAFKYITG